MGLTKTGQIICRHPVKQKGSDELVLIGYIAMLSYDEERPNSLPMNQFVRGKV